MAEQKPTVELNEVATVQRDITFPYFGGRLTNRDDTLATRGGAKGIAIYDAIERDGEAYGLLQKRKLAVMARPWKVTPASDSPLDKRAADICSRQLEAINFDLLTVNLLDAILKGYAVGEIMWAIQGGEIVAEEMIARDQRRFVFDDKRELRMLTLENLLEGEQLPERKFIAHSFGGKDGTPYGLGLGTRLFWYVFFKRQDITFWLTFLDKFGSPTAVGKYPPGTQPAEQTKLLAALAAIAQDTGVIVPEGMLIELLEATRNGSTDAYEKLAKYMDEQMSVIVLGETATTSSRGASLGSGGVAQVHNEVRLELVRADADLLSSTLNQTLLTWITEFNVPGATPPTVYRVVEEPKDLVGQAERDKSLYEMGFRPSLAYINDTYGGEWTEAPRPLNALPLPGAGPAAGAQFAEALNARFPDQAALDQAIDAIPAAALQVQAEGMLAPVMALLKSGASFQEVAYKLGEAYPRMSTTAFEELLERAIFVADLWGRLSADEEAGA